MSRYRFCNQRQRGRKPLSALHSFIVTLIMLSLVIIIIFLFMVAQSAESWQAEHNPTPSPVAYHASPAPTSKPSPTPTSKTSPRPTPTPTPHSSTSGYPIFNGNIHLPEIALSFDDGPSPPYTSQILSVLQSYSVKATFFVIGSRVVTYPALVRQEYQQGNAIGNHSWTHPDLTKLSSIDVHSQLQQTSSAIQTATGVTPTVFRPPYGNYNTVVQSIAASLGLSTVLWNVDPRDWALPGTSAIINNVLNSVHNGSIIEMHDGGGYRSETVAALPTIITTLEQRGYRFVTIPHLIQDLNLSSTVTPPSQIPFTDSSNLFAMLPHLSPFLKRREC